MKTNGYVSASLRCAAILILGAVIALSAQGHANAAGRLTLDTVLFLDYVPYNNTKCPSDFLSEKAGGFLPQSLIDQHKESNYRYTYLSIEHMLKKDDPWLRDPEVRSVGNKRSNLENLIVNYSLKILKSDTDSVEKLYYIYYLISYTDSNNQGTGAQRDVYKIYQPNTPWTGVDMPYCGYLLGTYLSNISSDYANSRDQFDSLFLRKISSSIILEHVEEIKRIIRNEAENNNIKNLRILRKNISLLGLSDSGDSVINLIDESYETVAHRLIALNDLSDPEVKSMKERADKKLAQEKEKAAALAVVDARRNAAPPHLIR